MSGHLHYNSNAGDQAFGLLYTAQTELVESCAMFSAVDDV